MARFSPPLTRHTIVQYVSPEGQVIPLSGGPDAGRYGVWMGHGPTGLDSVEVKALFDAAARQWGEEYVGETIDHAELEIPLFILVDPKTGIDGLRQRREWLKRCIPRDRVGWLCVYTNVTGWRWVAVRRGYFKAAIDADPATKGGLELELMLIVEQPLARVADSRDQWKRTDVPGGSILLRSGPEYHSWPQFTFRGPGALRVRYAGNDVTHPAILADETLLINTDEARPTIRAIRDNGEKRNLLPLLRGLKYRWPIPADTTTRVDFEITGGSAANELYGVSAIRIEGLL